MPKKVQKRVRKPAVVPDPSPPASDEEQEQPGSPISPPSSTRGSPTPTTVAPKKKKVIYTPLTEEQEISMKDFLVLHPQIYSKGMKAYKDAEKKKALWQEKAEELGVESGPILRKWYESVRTKVGKLFDVKSGSSRRERTERDRFMMDTFGFLMEHITRVRGRTLGPVSIIIDICNNITFHLQFNK